MNKPKKIQIYLNTIDGQDNYKEKTINERIPKHRPYNRLKNKYDTLEEIARESLPISAVNKVDYVDYLKNEVRQINEFADYIDIPHSTTQDRNTACEIWNRMGFARIYNTSYPMSRDMTTEDYFIVLKYKR